MIQQIASQYVRFLVILSLLFLLVVSGCGKGSLQTSGGPTPTPTPTPSSTSHSVSVTWSASATSGLQGYNVYRGTISGGPYSRVSAIPTTALQFTDGGVAASQTYFYVVTAVGGNGVESVTSNEIKVTVPTP